MNREEFSKLEESERTLLEGFRPGLYVRVELEHVPCELVTNFDPTYPIILGALQPAEDQFGYVQVHCFVLVSWMIMNYTAYKVMYTYTVQYMS